MKKITLRKILGVFLISIPFIGVFILSYYHVGLLTSIATFICAAIVMVVLYFGAKLVMEDKKPQKSSD